jgi:hypothetical protein
MRAADSVVVCGVPKKVHKSQMWRFDGGIAIVKTLLANAMAARKRLSPPEKIRLAEKFLDMTMSELRNGMDLNGGQIRAAMLRVPRMRGQLRLKILCRSNVPSCWSMSVVLYSPSGKDGRIDCIDFENRFEDVNGQICSGFHRHQWDCEQGDCERLKSGLPEESSWTQHKVADISMYRQGIPAI